MKDSFFMPLGIILACFTFMQACDTPIQSNDRQEANNVAPAQSNEQTKEPNKLEPAPPKNGEHGAHGYGTNNGGHGGDGQKGVHGQNGGRGGNGGNSDLGKGGNGGNGGDAD